MQKRPFDNGKGKLIDCFKQRMRNLNFKQKKIMKIRRMNMRMSGRIVMKKVIELLNLITIRISSVIVFFSSSMVVAVIFMLC